MFAVVVRVGVPEGAPLEQARQRLETQVIPMIRKTPGFAAAYWLAAPAAGGDGVSLFIYEDEESARAMAATMHTRPPVIVLSVEVREVVASA